MKKTAVIYWSGTGNTKTMAEAVLEGMKEAGADAALLEPGDVNGSTLSGVDAVAFGCPAMGSEVLEEMEFEPMARRSLCSAPMAGAMASGCVLGKRIATMPVSALPATALFVRKLLTMIRWPLAVPWARLWRNKQPSL